MFTRKYNDLAVVIFFVMPKDKDCKKKVKVFQPLSTDFASSFDIICSTYNWLNAHFSKLYVLALPILPNLSRSREGNVKCGKLHIRFLNWFGRCEGYEKWSTLPSYLRVKSRGWLANGIELIKSAFIHWISSRCKSYARDTMAIILWHKLRDDDIRSRQC